MADVLDDDAISEQLEDLDDWEVVDGALHRVFTFRDFAGAFAFMTQVALAAEKMDHHPDWSNSWNTVTFDIASHSDGGITDQCFELARKVEAAAYEPAVTN